VPIIAMTASAMRRDQEECLAAGMNDFIAKPVDPAELVKVLLRWVKPVEPGSAASSTVAMQEAATDWATEVPSGIEGLDHEVGLQHAAGKRKLYVSLLRRFADSQSETPDLIADAVARQDWPLAERLAHTLKGLSGTIGATRVQDVSATLEDALKARQSTTEIDRGISALRSALNGVIRGLRAWLSVEAESRGVAPDRSRVKTVCARLQELLNANDAEASDCLRQNRDLLKASFPSEFPTFESYVSNYDYESALAVLRAACKKQDP